MVDLTGHRICIKFSCLRNAVSAQYNFQRQCHGTNTCFWVSYFLNLYMRRLHLKTVRIPAIPPQFANRKTLTNFKKHKWRMTQTDFCKCYQVRPLRWNMSVNHKGLQQTADIHKVCAFFDYWQPETAVMWIYGTELFHEVRNDQHFLLRVITEENTWVNCYDPSTQQQFSKSKAYPLHTWIKKYVMSNISSGPSKL